MTTLPSSSLPQRRHDINPATRTPRGRSTQQFAADNLVKAQTVRKRLSQTGSYYGVVPEKLRNGRLRWPVTEGMGE